MEYSPQFFSMIVELIGNVGFPIVVSFFLLHRMESKLDDMVKVLQQLAQAIQSH